MLTRTLLNQQLVSMSRGMESLGWYGAAVSLGSRCPWKEAFHIGNNV